MESGISVVIAEWREVGRWIGRWLGHGLDVIGEGKREVKNNSQVFGFRYCVYGGTIY